MDVVSSSTLDKNKYTASLTEYRRRKTIEVQIGNVPLGGTHPIRVQSMTTVDTMDTEGSIGQSIRMIEAGCEYIRITAPSIKEAENLAAIKAGLKAKGYDAPLIADIHFTPNAAELAATIVEKVRVNPGNYADKKKFKVIEYTDESYQAELDRIRERFTPLVELCKQHSTAMRVGTNHGSLSDQTLSRYGDTPLGMVESALEFLRICEDLEYYDIVLSMKASNTQVMVQAYRMLVQKLDEEGLKPYPLHLGVTEAGEGEDGRIKSAVGIGTLLEDGLGDTVRVSLTEAPEAGAPVAQLLVDRYRDRVGHEPVKNLAEMPINPYQYHRRETREVANFGATNVPRVIADLSHFGEITYDDLKAVGHHYIALLDKWSMSDHGADYVYSGKNKISFMLPNGLKEIVDVDIWRSLENKTSAYPLMEIDEYLKGEELSEKLNFISVNAEDLTREGALEKLKSDETAVLILQTENAHAMAALRQMFFLLIKEGVKCPAVISRSFAKMEDERLQLYAATDMGGLLIDGLGDGAMLGTEALNNLEEQERRAKLKTYNATVFGILQAARTRMSKTEYISCPSCGRTLFDLQETTAMIRKRTDHLKGVKIGIMGCIVNGPGEMADADYGYVGVGKGKIALYRGQNVVKKSVPESEAVDQLIDLIREDGNWIEAVAVEH